MVVVINAINNEFAIASGSNVNVTMAYSYFDYPPNSTKGLVITSNAGDPSPYEFGVGDSYDLSWSGNGGSSTIEDAVVIRSDYVGPGQGAVVFEGTDSESGELVQLVWSPAFDLEGWYWSNGGSPSNPNAFWTTDQNATATYQTICFAEDTHVDTPSGPRPVQALRTGDAVLTLDNGSQPVLWVRRHVQRLNHRCDKSAPILIRASTLGKKRPHKDLIVSPQHRILVGGQGQLDDHFQGEAFVPAKALTVLPGIRQLLGRRTAIWVHFACARHEIVIADGCFSETLLLGDMVMAGLTMQERYGLHRAFLTSQAGSQPLNGPPARPCMAVRHCRDHLRERKTLHFASRKTQGIMNTSTQPPQKAITLLGSSA
ncbi:MAG: Hint domain-containing protein [Rhodobacteraceae bacterium]|nr:Hint domain-containing protein [Paracoccaceae bacterium]